MQELRSPATSPRTLVTRQFVRLPELEPIYEGVTRNQARAYEQNLLENLIGNSNKLNKINSISPKNKYHDDAVNWAQKNR